MARLIAVLALAALLAGAAAAGPSGQRVLVLLDDAEGMRKSHSRFLADLEGRGYSLDVRAIDDRALQLKSWDDWLYDKAVVLGSAKALGGAIDAAQLVDFVDAGHDLFLAVDGGVSEELRSLALDLGVDVDARGNAVIDHFAYDGALGKEGHATVLARDAVQSAVVLPGGLAGPVLFRGVGLSVPADSETAFLALSASPTAYAGKLGAAMTDAKLAGTSLGLVALAQLRNNARVAVAGSLWMLSDAAYGADATGRDGASLGRAGNEGFASAVSRWAFQERGVLRASNLSHRVVAGGHPGAVRPERYRVNDDVEFSVELHECADGECRPFQAEDVQVELVMLDPYVRATLQHDGQGRFATQVKVPDTYGVFKWVLEYRRLGYSYVELTETVPIRPFKHNEYERFIVQAYPYYASVASMMAGFLAVGAFFLYTQKADATA